MVENAQELWTVLKRGSYQRGIWFLAKSSGRSLLDRDRISCWLSTCHFLWTGRVERKQDIMLVRVWICLKCLCNVELQEMKEGSTERAVNVLNCAVVGWGRAWLFFFFFGWWLVKYLRSRTIYILQEADANLFFQHTRVWELVLVWPFSTWETSRKLRTLTLFSDFLF